MKALLDGRALLESLAGSHRASPIFLSDRQLLLLLLLGLEVGGRSVGDKGDVVFVQRDGAQGQKLRGRVDTLTDQVRVRDTHRVVSIKLHTASIVIDCLRFGHLRAVDTLHHGLQLLLVPAFELRFEGSEDLADLLLAQVEASLELLVRGTVWQLSVPLQDPLYQVIDLVPPFRLLLHSHLRRRLEEDKLQDLVTLEHN